MQKNYKNIISVLTISTGFTILYLLNGHKYFLILALIISLSAIMSPYLASKISIAWLWLGKILGFITNTVILTLLFFLILTPLAILSNRKRKALFFLGKAPEKSTFLERGHTYTAKDMENIW